MTQEELGRRAGLASKSVGRFERGQQTPELWETVELSRVLGRDPKELLTLWYHGCLKRVKELSELQGARALPGEESPDPRSPDPGSRVEQIIDQIAALAKEIYRESKSDFREIFLDRLAPPSAPPPSRPPRDRKRVRRKP